MPSAICGSRKDGSGWVLVWADCKFELSAGSGHSKPVKCVETLTLDRLRRHTISRGVCTSSKLKGTSTTCGTGQLPVSYKQIIRTGIIRLIIQSSESLKLKSWDHKANWRLISIRRILFVAAWWLYWRCSPNSVQPFNETSTTKIELPCRSCSLANCWVSSYKVLVLRT